MMKSLYDIIEDTPARRLELEGSRLQQWEIPQDFSLEDGFVAVRKLG